MIVPLVVVQGEEHELFVEEEGVWVHDGSLLVGG